jgi:Protein of unknown function (DUF1631)
LRWPFFHFLQRLSCPCLHLRPRTFALALTLAHAPDALMKPHPAHRLPAPLEDAVQRLKLAVREACTRTVDSLGLAALSATQTQARDTFLAAQFELNRKSAMFALAFNDAFDERMLRELSGRLTNNKTSSDTPAPPPAPAAPSRWDSLSLVDDGEVEAQLSADRLGVDLAHRCEWELRELDGYLAALLPELSDLPGEPLRNPLRPDLLGHALVKGVHAVTDRADVRKTLAAELARSLGSVLSNTYAAVLTSWRQLGLQPASLSVRSRNSRNSRAASAVEGAAAAAANDTGAASTRAGSLSPAGGAGNSGGAEVVSFGSTSRAHRSQHAQQPANGGQALGQIDPALMSVIRRLAYASTPEGSAGQRAPGSSRATVAAHQGIQSSADRMLRDASLPAGEDEGLSNSAFGQAFDGGAPMLPNVIRAHRDELRQASRGAVDHLVIDVIGFLFDHILADPKVPPQMARILARLQLPVLRAALGDPSFFSSRKHPVRRFVNRLATLGSAFEDFTEPTALAFLNRVRGLVQAVVDGDFDQMSVYEQQLAALEALAAEQPDAGSGAGLTSDAHAARKADIQADVQAAALLAQKEDEQQLHQLYAERLADDLKDVAAPAFLRDFVTRVWSQVLLRATERDGATGDIPQRLRHVGRDLFLSVLPKPTPAKRKSFLADLPKLMQELTEGMDLVSWPQAQRRAFFGQLMPAHAQALKDPASRQLDINLLARQVEGVLARPTPSRDDLQRLPASHRLNQRLPVLSDVLGDDSEGDANARVFSAEEARRLGLVDDAAVDWQGQAPAALDIDLSAAFEAPAAAIHLPGLPALVAGGLDIDLDGLDAGLDGSDASGSEGGGSTSKGRTLANNVQVGFAYQLHMEGAWHKVRLSHVSPGRNFFMFKRGSKQRETVSMTYRMLVRLCEGGRMRPFENATLLERAASRARRQLSALVAQHSA